MIGWSKLAEDIKNEVDKKILECLTNHIKSKHDNRKECESCGCLIGKSPIKGKPEIRFRKFPVIIGSRLCSYEYEGTEYIYTPYYCKRCYSELNQDSKKENNNGSLHCNAEFD